MDDSTRQSLIEINRDFYRRFASSFAETRRQPQPGFDLLLKYFHSPAASVLDIGCGEGRFGRFLSSHDSLNNYTGVDFTDVLLDRAKLDLPGEFISADISLPGSLENLGDFDRIICLATLQHIPGRSHRLGLLKEMKRHLTSQGLILMSNWQFLTSDRQRRKVLKWSQAGLSRDEVEENDYLLSWLRDGSGMRYVAFIDERETGDLAAAAYLQIRDQFRSDGKEEDLNLYTVLSR